jgi:hypothetical protein
MRGEPDPELTGSLRPKILDNAKALWESKPPYTKRPVDKAGAAAKVIGRIATLGISSLKGGGDTLRSVAVGWRPPVGPGTKRFSEVETKGTILGGIDTLSVAGIQPWASYSSRVQRLPALKLRGDTGLDLMLLGLVQDGAKASGDAPPKDLKKAAEYIRRKVKKYDLSAAAWHARSVRIAFAGQAAQSKAQTVGSAVSMGVGLTSTGLDAVTAGAAATLVGLPIAAITGTVSAVLKGVSLAISAAGGVTAAQEARNKQLIDQSHAHFSHELQMRDIRVRTKELEQQLAAMEDDSWLPDALREGEQLTKIIQVGAWVTVLGLTAAGTYLVVSRLRRD